MIFLGQATYGFEDQEVNNSTLQTVHKLELKQGIYKQLKWITQKKKKKPKRKPSLHGHAKWTSDGAILKSFSSWSILHSICSFNHTIMIGIDIKLVEYK